MRKLTLFVAALLMAVVVSAQENQPKQIKLTEEELQMVQSNNDFAFRLFRQARTNDSQILSPLSTFSGRRVHKGYRKGQQTASCPCFGKSHP